MHTAKGISRSQTSLNKISILLIAYTTCYSTSQTRRRQRRRRPHHHHCHSNVPCSASAAETTAARGICKFARKLLGGLLLVWLPRCRTLPVLRLRFAMFPVRIFDDDDERCVGMSTSNDGQDTHTRRVFVFVCTRCQNGTHAKIINKQLSDYAYMEFPRTHSNFII